MDGGVRGQYEKFIKMPLISALAPESECALSMSNPRSSWHACVTSGWRRSRRARCRRGCGAPTPSRILWANPTGAAIFGAATSAAIGTRKFDTGQPAAAQIAQLATTLPPDGSPRLERLRGFGAGVGRALACACSRITLADDTPAILVVAAERAGPELALDERVRRLLAGCDAPVAAFTPDGKLIHATPAAAARLDGATSLAALGVAALAADAVQTGRAAGETAHGPIAVDRIGSEAATVLLATFPLAARPTSPRPASCPLTPEPIRRKSDAMSDARSLRKPGALPPIPRCRDESMPPSDAAQAPPEAQPPNIAELRAGAPATQPLRTGRERHRARRAAGVASTVRPSPRAAAKR